MNTCTQAGAATSEKPAWGAVFSLAFGVFALVTAEFLPASLLTPMAASLNVTEGMAGQAITATAVLAMLTSLLIATATRRIDRRIVLLAFSGLLVTSNLLVAFAPSLSAVLLGRVLLGIAIGGFWTMATATVMRLVPPADVPRALSIVFSGVSVATIAAAPLGSYLGHLIGWRNVFLATSALGLMVFAWQWTSLPGMAPRGSTRLGTLLEVLMRPGIGLGMASVILVFGGHFAFFTYLRPFLERVAGVGVEGLSAILLGFGVANFIGTPLAGWLLARNLRRTLMLAPFAMGVTGLVLASLGHAPIADAALIAFWGLAFGAVPVGWSTWLAQAVPDEPESGGGLLVAAVQSAITAGAAAGGVVFDIGGAAQVFLGSACVLLIAAMAIFTGVRVATVVKAAG